VMAKSADVGAVVAQLVKAGIPADKFTKHEEGDAVTLGCDGAVDLAKQDGTQLVKVSDDVSLVVTGIKKSFDGWDFESTSFKEIMSKGAFIPSLCVAQDMLSRTMYNIMEKAENPKTAAQAIKSAAADFGDYVTMLAKGLPDSAFKADVALHKAYEDKKDGGKDDADENADGSKKKAKKVDGDGSGFAAATGQESAKATAEDEASPNNAKKKPNEKVPGIMKNEGDADVVAGKAGNKLDDKTSGAGAQQADPGTEQVVKADTSDIAKMLAEMTNSFTTTVNDLKKHVDSSVQKMDDKVTDALKKTDAALSGAVTGTEQGDDRTGVTKTEVASAPPLLDTGYIRHDMDKVFPVEKGPEGYRGRRH
jgi:hypothetical protein